MRFAIPRKNREYASWPPLDQLPALAAGNIALASHYAFNVLDLPYPLYAQLCREAATRAASGFAKEAGITAHALDRAPVIATGHQPELFHAGVWIKNFLVARLAAHLGGSGANLILDSDVPKHLGLVAPVREDGAVRRMEVSFAHKRGEIAFEEYPPRFDHLDAFEEELRAAAGAPLRGGVEELVARLRRSNRRGRNIGEAMALARISSERELGVGNAEVPASRLADEPAFGAFVLSILTDAPRFAAAYNDALARYRSAHRIRSRANPMSDLAFDGSRVEVPFWVWRGGADRGRLFVEGTQGQIALYNGHSEVGRMSAGTYAEAESEWRRVVTDGLKLRPRAIATTLFMRLFVSDLFVHGVGGAAYDEVTNDLTRAFYGVEPPAYATVTATMTLPSPGRGDDAGRIAALKRRLRDFVYNPQRLLDEGRTSPGEVRRLIDERRRLVESIPADRDGRRLKWEGIRRINGVLRARLAAGESAAARELADAEKERAADETLLDRDYSVFLVGTRDAAAFYDGVLSRLAAASPAGNRLIPPQ